MFVALFGAGIITAFRFIINLIGFLFEMIVRRFVFDVFDAAVANLLFTFAWTGATLKKRKKALIKF